jgi:hypothetical protein
MLAMPTGDIIGTIILAVGFVAFVAYYWNKKGDGGGGGGSHGTLGWHCQQR